jgi:hypothetical protein
MFTPTTSSYNFAVDNRSLRSQPAFQNFSRPRLAFQSGFTSTKDSELSCFVPIRKPYDSHMTRTMQRLSCRGPDFLKYTVSVL